MRINFVTAIKQLDKEVILAYQQKTMNNSTNKNLAQLKAYYGQWNAVAAALGMEARSLRHVRRNISKSAKHLIAIKVKQLRLARVLTSLLRSGAITRTQLRRAWIDANKIL